MRNTSQSTSSLRLHKIKNQKEQLWMKQLSQGRNFGSRLKS